MIGDLEDRVLIALLHEAGLRGPVEKQQQVFACVTHLGLLEIRVDLNYLTRRRCSRFFKLHFKTNL